MATSGSLSSSSYQGRKITFSWERTSCSVANNTSTISWTLKGDGEASSSWYYSGNFKVTIAGDTEYSSSTRIKLYDGTKIASGTKTIKHNSDGTKSFSVSIKAGIYTVAVNCTGSKTFTLTTIPRASSVSATSAYVGENSTITINRASSSFTHTLAYTFGSLSGTIATKTSNTSISFKLPDSFYAQIGSTATSKSGTITCTTYNGSTSLGSKTCSFTAKTNSSTCAPTLSPTAIDSNTTTVALTGDSNKFIKYYSNASVSTGAVAKNSATLKSYKISCGSKSITTASGTINNVESGSFTFSATDSRGYTTTETFPKPLINYVKLSCSFSADMTVDGVISFTAKGNYFNGSFGAVDNTLQVQYRYMPNGGTYTEWADITATKSGNTYTASGTVSGLDYKTTYIIEVRAVDKLATVTPDSQSVKALPIFDWGEEDFNHNTHVTLSNGMALQSFTTEGEKNNLIYLTASNNLQIGGGSFAPQAIYFRAAEDGDIRVSNENSEYYSLLGAAKALSNSYDMETTYTLGSNYSSGSVSATLVGSCLRLALSATRSTGATVGNITNEEVMVINLKHSGKIKNLYRVDFNNGTEGGVVALDVQASKIDDNNVKLTVRLCATTTAVVSFNAYTVIPASLNLTAFV